MSRLTSFGTPFVIAAMFGITAGKVCSAARAAPDLQVEYFYDSGARRRCNFPTSRALGLWLRGLRRGRRW
jgi:hypothetical protein